MWEDGALEGLIIRLELEKAPAEIRAGVDKLLSGFAEGAKTSGEGEVVFTVLRSCSSMPGIVNGEVCLEMMRNMQGFRDVKIEEIIKVCSTFYTSPGAREVHDIASHQNAFFNLLEQRLTQRDLLESVELLDQVSKLPQFQDQCTGVLYSILKRRKPEEVMVGIMLLELESIYHGLGSLIKAHLNEVLAQMCDMDQYERALGLADQCIDAGVNEKLGFELLDTVAFRGLAFLDLPKIESLSVMLSKEEKLTATRHFSEYAVKYASRLSPKSSAKG